MLQVMLTEEANQAIFWQKKFDFLILESNFLKNLSYT